MITLLIGLGVAVGQTRAADEDDDKPAAAPKAKYGRGPGLVQRLFQSNEKPADKKPAANKPKATDEKQAEKKPVSAPEGAVAVRAKEEAAWIRRLQVCDRLKNLANQNNDDELYRQAEELEQRAWAVYLQRTAHLPASNATSETDEQILDRHLGNRTSAADTADALTPAAAKAKDRRGQSASLEGKR
jgi:hypothetical protein